MSTGKNFNLFLMDGTVTGRIKCTLANWTGLAFKIPRTHLAQSKERMDLKQSGVYFLFGKNDADEDEVYIGQAGIRKNGEGVLFRVAEHLKDEDYFSDRKRFCSRRKIIRSARRRFPTWSIVSPTWRWRPRATVYAMRTTPTPAM